MTEVTVSEQGIGNAMIYIADKLGMTIEQMYQVYFHSQRALAMIQLSLILAFIVGTIIITYVMYRVYTSGKVESKYMDLLQDFGKCFVIWIVVVFTLAIVLVTLYYPIVALVCPEYTAIQSMISSLRSVVR